MVAIDLKSLVARLSSLCRRQLEASAGLTLSRSHYNVEIEHFLLKLVVPQNLFFKVVTFPTWLHFVAHQFTRNVTTLVLYSFKCCFSIILFFMAQKSLRNIWAYIDLASENIDFEVVSFPAQLHFRASETF